MQLRQKGHMGSIKDSAVLGEAIAVLSAAEMLQEAISSSEDGLGLSGVDHRAPSSVIICSFAAGCEQRGSHPHPRT